MKNLVHQAMVMSWIAGTGKFDSFLIRVHNLGINVIQWIIKFGVQNRCQTG